MERIMNDHALNPIIKTLDVMFAFGIYLYNHISKRNAIIKSFILTIVLIMISSITTGWFVIGAITLWLALASLILFLFFVHHYFNGTDIPVIETTENDEDIKP